MKPSDQYIAAKRKTFYARPFPLLLCGVAVFLLGSCAVPDAAGPVGPSSRAAVAAPAAGKQIRIAAADRRKIGQKIWKNECGGTVAGLMSWNDGEAFASLGIGHFIWYPEGRRGPYEESFPQLVAFAKARGHQVPSFYEGPCPWPKKVNFVAARDSGNPQYHGLANWLKATVDLQTDFIIARMEAALPKLLAAAPVANRDRVKRQFYAVASSPQGIYALVDYVNFKGEGTNTAERYKGQGWGMLQVLEGMENVGSGPGAAVEFGRSAKRTLQRRVANASGNEERWMKGWANRCDTYGRPL